MIYKYTLLYLLLSLYTKNIFCSSVKENSDSGSESEYIEVGYGILGLTGPNKIIDGIDYAKLTNSVAALQISLSYPLSKKFLFRIY